MKTTVIFKVSKDGEKFAVFTKTKEKFKFFCYSFDDCEFFEADVLFLSECKNIQKDDRNILCESLKSLGYNDIKIQERMKY